MISEVEVRITREVTEDEVFDGPVRRFFERLVLAAHREVARPGRVPIDTNRLRSSLNPGGGVTGVSGSFEDGYEARVGTNVETYPRVLEESDRHLYRGGPSAGQPTKGWLSKTVPGVEGEIPGLLSQLSAEIEAVHRG